MVAAEDTGGLESPGPGLRVARSSSGGWEVVAISGDLDLAGMDQVEEALDAALRDAHEGVLVELSALTFIGSEGIRGVLQARERAVEEERGFRVVAGDGPARRLIELLGLSETLGLEGS